MIVNLNLNIPPHFFESADKENDYESVSEHIAKSVIENIINSDYIERGNPIKSEPDYITNSEGYEVTFAIKSSIIPQLKGVKPIKPVPIPIETKLIADINEALERKAEKQYSLNTNLVLITLMPFLYWEYPLNMGNGECSELVSIAKVKKRDEFFQAINNKYIKTNIFSNVYIIQPTHDEHLDLFYIKEFSKGEEYLKRLSVDNKVMFPTCKVLRADYEDNDFGETFHLNYRITVTNHSKYANANSR